MSRSYEPPTGYGRIKRGPMAADNYTQVANELFRDPSISFKAKGIFGLISTHRESYGVTPESLAAASTDGVSSVKTGLRELEAAGYLERHQGRRADGTMGKIEYWITDRPTQNRQREIDHRPPPAETQEKPRSEPVDEKPPAVGGMHKKTSSKNPRQNPNQPLFPAAGDGSPNTAAPSRSLSAADEKFVEFWEAWPKKLDKKPAHRAWTAAVRAGADADQIIAFVRLQAQAWQSMRKDPQYIPYPATWLRKERFTGPLDAGGNGGHQSYRNPAEASDYLEGWS